jgi:pSer/pThr/pTyr-binding forkhead associated (FHA) protein
VIFSKSLPDTADHQFVLNEKVELIPLFLDGEQKRGNRKRRWWWCPPQDKGVCMARLILTLNNEVLSNHQILPGHQLTIGRHPDNKIIIENRAVSAHHATVRAEGQTLVLTDLGSRNGTYVNNEKAEEAKLAHQDWVGIGKHILIVDLHESLSMEATAKELMGSGEDAMAADQTMVLDYQEAQPSYVGFEYLSFLSTVREDFELTSKGVAIGKNQDADIKISGFWSLFAGQPSATITKKDGDYILTYVHGMLTPQVNGKAVKQPIKLKHQDIIKIGPLKVQIRFVRRPAK